MPDQEDPIADFKKSLDELLPSEEEPNLPTEWNGFLLAPYDKRLIAFIIDFFIFLALLFVSSILLFILNLILEMLWCFLLFPMELPQLIAKFFAMSIPMGYLLLRDSFNGQSYGKRLLGLQVLDMKTNEPIGFFKSAVRSVTFLLLPFFYFVPLMIEVFFIRKDTRRRLGDLWAGTIVIMKDNVDIQNKVLRLGQRFGFAPSSKAPESNSPSSPPSSDDLTPLTAAGSPPAITEDSRFRSCLLLLVVLGLLFVLGIGGVFFLTDSSLKANVLHVVKSYIQAKNPDYSHQDLGVEIAPLSSAINDSSSQEYKPEKYLSYVAKTYEIKRMVGGGHHGRAGRGSGGRGREIVVNQVNVFVYVSTDEPLPPGHEDDGAMIGKKVLEFLDGEDAQSLGQKDFQDQVLIPKIVKICSDQTGLPFTAKNIKIESQYWN